MASFVILMMKELLAEKVILFLMWNMASMVSPQMTLMGNMAIKICLRLKALLA